jgi:hypothetical protein
MKNKLSSTEEKAIRAFVNGGRGLFIGMNTSSRDCYYFNSFDRDEDGKIIEVYDSYVGRKVYLWTGTFSYGISEFWLKEYEWVYNPNENKFYWCDDLREKRMGVYVSEIEDRTWEYLNYFRGYGNSWDSVKLIMQHYKGHTNIFDDLLPPITEWEKQGKPIWCDDLLNKEDNGK